MPNNLGSQNTSKVSFRRIFMIALPVMFANIAMPLQGLIDVVMTARFGDASMLAALGLATQLMTVLLVSFNFLQYSSSGLSAQAFGSGACTKQLLSIIQRAAVLALMIGALLFVLHTGITQLGLMLLSASADATQFAQSYLNIRFFGVIAELLNYVFVGFFAGLGRTRLLLILQSIIALTNISLSLLFVTIFGYDLSYVALGTTLAHWLGVFIALLFISQSLSIRMVQIFTPTPDTKIPTKFLELLSLNKDIFIRTVLLTLSFAWITKLSATHGDITLSATVLLLQILSLSAYALDGFAVATESLCGQAAGKNSLTDFKTTLRLTGVAISTLAAVLSLLWWLNIDWYLHYLTQDDALIATATIYAPFAVILPTVGAFAYWLDGVYFGLTAGKEIRNSALVVSILFFVASYWLHQHYAMTGIWLSLLLLLSLRAIVLAAQLPKLMRSTFYGKLS